MRRTRVIRRARAQRQETGSSVWSARIQPKLQVSDPGDRYEQEADAVAEQLMSGALSSAGTSAGSITPLVQRQAAEQVEEEEMLSRGQAEGTDLQRQEEEEEEEILQAKQAGTGRGASLDAGFESRLEGEKSRGAPLDPRTRDHFASRFGADFGSVRVHADSAAAELARSARARAFTHRNHIFFSRGQYDPHSGKGRRLLAHELTHTIQQGAVRPGGGPLRHGAGHSPARSATVQRADDDLEPTQVTFAFTDPVHTPPCGNATLRARTDGDPVTWSLEDGSAQVDAGTTISEAGVITISPAQQAGNIKVKATGASSFAFRELRIRSHPTGIASTRIEGAAPASDYGAVFEHVFDSADGDVASLENVAVGERFPGVPSPNAASHAIGAPLNPFGGTFTLETSTLTSDASDNWFLTAAGELGGSHDSVVIGQAGINVGRFVRSASQPRPPQGLPATMTIDQHLHWFCPQRPAANRWTDFVTVAHSRTLRNRAGTVEFVVTVNGVEQVDDYVGPTAVSNLTASPVSTPRSQGAPPGGGAAPAAREVSLSVDTLPSPLRAGETVTWSIIGNDLGCTVAADAADPTRATLTIGTRAGTVTVQAADASGTNRARVSVRIT